MFSRYFKFYIYSLIAVVGTLIITVPLNMYATTSTAFIINMCIKAFMLVMLFESMLYYNKIMKVLVQVVDNITPVQVAVGVVSPVVGIIGIGFIGYSNLAFFILFGVGVTLRYSFKINQINRVLPHLCMDIDAEVEEFNQELESGTAEEIEIHHHSHDE